jgi:single-strand DNA-binding protein
MFGIKLYGKALNRVTLLGNLGQDPELRSTPQGSSVCNLNIATSESYKDKNSGDWKRSYRLA